MGGKGSGRKREISPDIAAKIRHDCEVLDWAVQIEQRHATVVREAARRELWGNNKIWHDVPLSERPLLKKYGVDDTKSSIPKNLSLEAIYAIETMRANRKSVAKKLGRAIPDGEQMLVGLTGVPEPRQYGKRAAIIRAVAADWGVSERQVRKIWETADT